MPLVDADGAPAHGLEDAQLRESRRKKNATISKKILPRWSMAEERLNQESSATARWGDEDEELRYQAFRKALMEDEVIEDYGGEYRPEKQPNGEK